MYETKSRTKRIPRREDTKERKREREKNKRYSNLGRQTDLLDDYYLLKQQHPQQMKTELV